MDIEHGVKRWPQAGNYRPNLDFMQFSYSRISKPKPLDPKYYVRHAAFKETEDKLKAELEDASAKVAKVEVDLAAAEAALAENKWSKANAKLSNVQRLKNLLAEVKAVDNSIRLKMHANTKDNACLLDIIRLQESMEATYRESQL